MNKFTGMLLGLAPILFGGLLSLLIYDSWPTLIGLVVIGILTLLSLLLARSIFLTVSDLGGNEFISRVGASPDLDNLIHSCGMAYMRAATGSNVSINTICSDAILRRYIFLGCSFVYIAHKHNNPTSLWR